MDFIQQRTESRGHRYIYRNFNLALEKTNVYALTSYARAEVLTHLDKGPTSRNETCSQPTRSSHPLQTKKMKSGLHRCAGLRDIE